MKLNLLNYFLITLIAIGCTNNTITQPSLAPVDKVVDNYFGIDLTDPYRYMENLQDTGVVNWLKEQSDYTRTVLNSISGRQELIDKMREFDSRKSERIYRLQITENDYYFYLKQTPDDETGKLFYRKGFKGEEMLLLDPENYKDDTLNYSISVIYPTSDGTKIAIEISPNGSESAELIIIDVVKKEYYQEIMDRVWYAGLSWLPGNERFTYVPMRTKDVHDPKRLLDLIVYIHNLGDKYDNDTPIFSSSMYPDLKIEAKEVPFVIYEKANDKIYLIPYTVERNLKVFIADVSEIDDKKIRWKKLFDRDDEVHGFISTKVDIYAHTPKNAPNFKIVKTSLNNPDIKNAKTVIEEDKEGKIESFVITNKGLFYNLSRNGVKQELFFLSKDKQKAQQIDLPVTAGRIGITAKGIDYPDLWININGWTTDYTRYSYKTDANEFIKETLSSQAEYPEYKNLVVEELMIPSHDGVMVPLSLIYDKNLKKEGNNPLFLYGYGAYGISNNPVFNPNYLLPTTKGTIFAIAHVRGGGELGNEWYKAGFKTTKPNTWKDLIVCAEYLVKENYTNPGKIAINGVSAGGILIGRAMTERPDLFAAAIPEVGCMNTVRAEFSANGPGNIPEFGTVKDSVECMALIEMDSYHNIQDATNYPATLVTAGFNDPRVIAWQPAKFAARLMAANGSNKPVLLWVDFKSGHGIGDSKSQYFESLADKFSFALWQSGHPEFKAKY